MMNDRFSVQLRQHLLETANERPADGQLATIVGDVALTPQRRPLIARLPQLRGRIGPFPAAIRYGLIALALVLAAITGALLAGGGGSRPSTPFEGTWTATDLPDGSTLNLYVGAGTRPSVRFEDLFATGDACIADASKVFTADGVGEITGNRLVVSYPNGGGCGSVLVPIGGAYDFDRDADTLVDQDGVIWTRIPGGDGPVPTVPPEPSSSSSSSPGAVFEGRWTATDVPDGSTLTLVVGAGAAPVVQFQDDVATGPGCAADQVKVFRADGVGEITENRLVVFYPDGGGCGLMLIPIAGLYDYDAGTDTMRDPDGVTWTRVPEGADPAPTLRPAPTRTAGCVDLAHGGTYRALAGPVALTATVPSKPAIPWQGLRETFNLSASCEDPSPMTVFAMGATSVNDSSCMPSSAEITDFADAIARLDTPKGNDISDRIDLTIDGHPAARYDISKLSTCPGFGLWSGTIIGRGETGSTYVIDVDGLLIEIELNRNGDQTPAEMEETYAIIASLQITR